MTTPHRATPEQWAMLEEQSAPEYDNTILELLSRIEALEATQHAPTAEARPEPQGPRKHELFGLLMQAGGATQCVSVEWLEPFADAVLARWGRPAIEPVPVAERPWEREGWCDAEGRCYGWDGDYWWMVGNPGWANETITHWLPHWALPVPQQEVK